MAALFSQHGQTYQELSAELTAYHKQLVQTLTASAQSYASAEAVNAAAFAANPVQFVEQQLLNAVNAPFQTYTGRPLIGNGANGASGSGQAGAPGGWLLGNGGVGGSGAAEASVAKEV